MVQTTNKTQNIFSNNSNFDPMTVTIEMANGETTIEPMEPEQNTIWLICKEWIECTKED